jgi:uncharacterized protein YutE (UPF0331/DUF86 family)
MSTLREQLVSELLQECQHYAEERASRYLSIKHHGIVANTEFAAASAECIDLFRDGHYYGAISLSQAVAEALVRHMCRTSGWRPAGKFEENVQTLKRRGVIEEDVASRLVRLWERRDDYHHLNRSVATERNALEELALTKVRDLAEIERWVFGFSFRDGKLALHRPQFWPGGSSNSVPVYLRRPMV